MLAGLPKSCSARTTLSGREKSMSIDRTPFKAATKPVIVEFAKSMGLTDLLASIDDVK